MQTSLLKYSYWIKSNFETPLFLKRFSSGIFLFISLLSKIIQTLKNVKHFSWLKYTLCFQDGKRKNLHKFYKLFQFFSSNFFLDKIFVLSTLPFSYILIIFLVLTRILRRNFLSYTFIRNECLYEYGFYKLTFFCCCYC